jgi:carotenoid cleavage dioxygenase
MATPYPRNDPYLRRGFEPIRMECDSADLVVDGAVPEGLNGTLYRIGPNPQFAPRGRYNPLQGDGMIHAFRIDQGRIAYRNRWVRTRQWTLERAAGRALFALEEGHAPIAIDPVSIDTLGAWTFDGALPGNMTAHPKIDPDTGEMLFFANFPTRKFDGAIAFYVADARGRLTRRETIQGPFPALVHDFAVTKDFVIFVVCPLTLSLERARAGGAPIGWEPELRTHVGVLARNGAGDMRWYTGAPCMAWHTLNAFDDGARIFVDVCRQDAPAFRPRTAQRRANRR